MVFEYILKKNDIDPANDLSIDQSIDFGSTAAAFSGGQGDFSVEFEPHATSLETKGDGYVVASLGEDSGYVPYTAFSARKSYIEKNPEVIESFTRALQKGMDYVQTHTPAEIAKVIAPQFAETDLATIEQSSADMPRRTHGNQILFSRRTASPFWRTFWKKRANWTAECPTPIWWTPPSPKKSYSSIIPCAALAAYFLCMGCSYTERPAHSPGVIHIM